MSVRNIPIWPEVVEDVPMTFLHGEPGWYVWLLHKPDPNLKLIERDLMLLFNNGDLKDFPVEVSPESGIYVCTLIENKIIRGLVLNKYKTVVPEEGSDLILDVDSGVILPVPKSQLKLLPAFACKAPARAVRCDLGLDCKERFDWPSQMDELLKRILSDATLLVTFESERPGSIPTVSVNARLWNPRGPAFDFRIWLTQYIAPVLDICSLSGYIPEPVFNNKLTEPCNQSQPERPKTEEASTVPTDSMLSTHLKLCGNLLNPNSMLPQIGPPPGFGGQQPTFPPGFNPPPGFNLSPGFNPSYPGFNPSYPGFNPSYPGFNPSYPGFNPSSPGFNPSSPGFIPSSPGFNPLMALMFNQGFAYPTLLSTTMWRNPVDNYADLSPPPSLPHLPPMNVGTHEKAPRVDEMECPPVPNVSSPQNINTSKINTSYGSTEAVPRMSSPVLTAESLLEEFPTLKIKAQQEVKKATPTADSLPRSTATTNSLLPESSYTPKTSNVLTRAEGTVNHLNGGILKTQAGRNHVTLREIERHWPVGTVVEVIMSHVDTPECFAANVVDNSAIHFQRLQKVMARYHDSLPLSVSTKEEVFELIGDFCACYCPDEDDWFRAEINDWHFEDPKGPIEVWSVDFGGLYETDLSWIRRLEGEATILPMQAALFSMHNVRPRLPCSGTEEEWPEEHCEAICRLIPIGKLFWLKIEKPRSDDNKFWPVSVYKDSNCSSPSLNTTLVARNLAFFRSSLPEPNQPSIRAIPVRTEWDPMQDDYERGGRNYDYDDEDACLAVSGYKPQVQKNVCRFFIERGSCPKGLNCRQRHIKGSPDDWLEEQEMVFTKAFEELALPSEGSVFIMKITKIVQVHHFFGIKVPSTVSSSQEHYLMLSKQMNDPKEVRNFKFCRTAPAFGQLVLARNNNKNYWFRGRVIDVDHSSEDRFEVLDVDTGCAIGVERKDLREMEAAFLHLPFQPIECFLWGMAPVLKDPKFSKEGCARVSQLVQDTVKVCVVNKTIEDALEVKVIIGYREDGRGGQDLSDVLLREGYAQKGPRRITSREVCRYRPG